METGGVNYFDGFIGKVVVVKILVFNCYIPRKTVGNNEIRRKNCEGAIEVIINGIGQDVIVIF